MALWPIWISIQPYPVMVSVVSSIPARGNLLKFFKFLDVNFGLKCKCDLIMKNSFWSAHAGKDSFSPFVFSNFMSLQTKNAFFCNRETRYVDKLLFCLVQIESMLVVIKLLESPNFHIMFRFQIGICRQILLNLN